MAELGTRLVGVMATEQRTSLLYLLHSGSVDGNNQLIIKGRFQQKQIETVLRRYISKVFGGGGGGFIVDLFSVFSMTGGG